ncbi:MAG: HD domain-containing protein [Candidatus Pacebacteria bacterium]|nr:HD domain-containing protein [Candidatus Paceibacterota bacterium]
MKIPKEVQAIIDKLNQNSYEAYAVGGCVRDLLLNKEPNDWDVATNARPEDITRIFPKSFYENDFGTVSVLTQSQKENLKTIEITPFRIESKYSDKRHPDEVKFAKNIGEDLARRDFTVNAIALSVAEGTEKIIDLFHGQDDLENKIIRAVGDPNERFQEDALRLMRAVRFATSLNSHAMWAIEAETKRAIQKNNHLLQRISQERIRDELIKMIMSPLGARGLELLRRLGLLQYVLPELEGGFNIEQNKHHIFQIYQHNLLSLNYACSKGFSLTVRLAALLHDIAKPQTKKGQGLNSTFYNHEVVGAKITYQILRRLKFPKKDIEKITKLVRFHLFYYNVDEVGESSVRRLLRNVGQENIEELLQLRQADRKGSGVPKAEPYKLRHLKYLFDKVAQDPILPNMLKINGLDIMRILNIQPGPKIGQILSYLLSQVLSDPQKNDQGFLESEIKKIGVLTEQELQKLAKTAKQEIEQVETKKDEMTKKKYWVT